MLIHTLLKHPSCSCIQNAYFDKAIPIIPSISVGGETTANIESFLQNGWTTFFYHLFGASHFVMIHVAIDMEKCICNLHIFDSLKGYYQSNMRENASLMKNQIRAAFNAWRSSRTFTNTRKILDFKEIFVQVPQQSSHGNDCLIASCYFLYYIYSYNFSMVCKRLYYFINLPNNYSLSKPTMLPYSITHVEIFK